ncbi:MAG: glycine--tRNA ligase [Candidatus Thalassarchaeum betae]|jgi:glycyl-tRNA synthetase|uniref:glycine--tRNA ligase n=1 Tax=Candidatus Thalassarchaeum betae TaxID=2599289 RepID=A0A2V3HSS2_9ARCH|nr:MAG: glycine--tRNA ligase [Candidatus Thalassoarchaea betae]PXF25389.1 MAG: glycine--tRNA ligase [Euryarchaeota archaeon]HIC50906.1 glycine--tRNA ligase [Candidatus Poseidoniales archaeon]HIM64819.1 glycine--tRNA ligase [Candidatus Poseidoniales archaeon]
MSGRRVDRLTSILRRRGIVLPSFEIYGGVSGLIDYGPVGAHILRRVMDKWIDHWTSHGDIVEIDSPTITPEPILVASGHVSEFNDLMAECGGCGSAFRADHLADGRHEDPDSLDADAINAILDAGVKCPTCSESKWSDVRMMNLMFSTRIGAMKGARVAYMRPETAQGMFMLYPVLFRHFRQRLPFGAIQTGKGYRNEISPRQGMIRLREFNMAELEYFIDPEEPPCPDLSAWGESVSFVPDPDGSHPGMHAMTFSEALSSGIVRHPTVAWFLARTWDFLIGVGIDSTRIRFRQHAGTEMAHYADDCWDCELHGEYGWVECVGIANRTCHDLLSHEQHSGSKLLRGWRQYPEPRTEIKDVLAPIGAVIGPVFKDEAGAVMDALKELSEIPDSTPFTLSLADASSVEITNEMVTRRAEEVTVHGEWFTPHVIEPAFGIDRIIWHILDHGFTETEKEGGEYSIMSLDQTVAPFDIAILPLFDKDGMGDIARQMWASVNSMPGVRGEIDSSKSIGRRYARVDEIGVPWAITVDHTTLEDGTVTVRRRDDQEQIRASVDEVLSRLASGEVSSLF